MYLCIGFEYRNRRCTNASDVSSAPSSTDGDDKEFFILLSQFRCCFYWIIEKVVHSSAFISYPQPGNKSREKQTSFSEDFIISNNSPGFMYCGTPHSVNSNTIRCWNKAGGALKFGGEWKANSWLESLSFYLHFPVEHWCYRNFDHTWEMYGENVEKIQMNIDFISMVSIFHFV